MQRAMPTALQAGRLHRLTAPLPVQPAALGQAQRRPARRHLMVVAAGDRPRRLLAWVLSAPRRVESYFEAYPIRKVLWCGISTGLGYYAALAINDILAAILTVVFYEVVTEAFYSADKKTLRLWFAQCFKIGVVAAMLADALKLQV